MYKSNEGMNVLKWAGFVAVLAGMMCFGTGCSLMDQNGLGEFHLTVGHRSVTKREVKEETYRTDKPAICYLLPSRCAGQQAQPTQQGQQPEGS